MIKKTAKKNSQKHVKLELQTTTPTVNEKLLPGDASMSLSAPSENDCLRYDIFYNV
jgi:hypothetical protein